MSSTSTGSDERVQSVFERSEAHRWARQEIFELESLISEVEGQRRAAVDVVRRALEARTQASVAGRLAELPVEELARRGSNIRTKPLLENGIRTALDLKRRGRDRVTALRGINEFSTSQLFKLLDATEHIVPSDLRPRADPTRWSRYDVDLVRALRLFASVTTLLGIPHVDTLGQVIALLRAVARATRWLMWLFSRRAKRAAVAGQYWEARVRLNTRSVAAVVGELRRGLVQAQQLADSPASESEVVADWRASSATLQALLDQFVADYGTAIEREILQHIQASEMIASKLARRIGTSVLDTRLIVRQLRAYQIFGAKFALVVGKALLGDDMGLGKTTQALAAIAHTMSSEDQLHHVVMCPASLIDNWHQEVTVVCPKILAHKFRQPGRQAAYESWLAKGGILLVSYQQLDGLLSQPLPELGFVVADEAHFIKNPEAKRTKLAQEVVRRAGRVLLMGGTLLENRAQELISLTTVAHPLHGARLKAIFGDGGTAHLREEEFRRALGELYLRRNQEDVLDELPGIIASDEPIDVGHQERTAYADAIKEGNLMKARQALSVAAGPDSEKMRRLGEIVEESRVTNRKMLIFSYFREVVHTARAIVGDDCGELLGGISMPERQRRIESFCNTDGFAALALQIEVGGIGLNLQPASVVVLMEPQYKPSTEWQAIDRSHRMGQTQRVVTYRLIAENSIDERLVELSGFKAELFDKLARQSYLADSSPQALDPVISEEQLLAAERNRLGIPPQSAA